jgi:hypothetical protein
MKSLVLLCLVVNSYSLQALTYDPTEVLLNVRKKVVATVEKLPNYACRETVQRMRVTPPVDAPGAACEALANLRNTRNGGRHRKLTINWRLMWRFPERVRCTRGRGNITSAATVLARCLGAVD